MSQTSENAMSGQGSDFASIAKMFNDYEKAKTVEGDKPVKLTKEQVLAKYFTPRNSTEYFRILPPLPGRDVVESAYFHYVPTNDSKSFNGKTYRKIFCPAHNSPKVPKRDAQGNVYLDQQGKPVMVAQRCPLCEKKNEILAKQIPLKNSEGKFLKKEEMNPQQLEIKAKNDELYKKAMQFDAKKYHIVRGIDKGKPKDGVKYWRFKDNFKNQGVLDKLIPALKIFFEEYKINPTDVENGSDLYINVVEAEIPGTKKKYKDVSSITARKPSKLYDDPIIVQQWLNDKSTWRDVFKPVTMTRVLTPEQYLEKVALGIDPYWDENSKKWVFPSPADAELQAKANEKTQSLEATKEKDVELASDLANSSTFETVNITNVTKEDVGTYQDDFVDVSAKFSPQAPQPTATQNTNVASQSVTDTEEEDSNSGGFEDGEGDYDDLPF